jgi:hypothetical protein
MLTISFRMCRSDAKAFGLILKLAWLSAVVPLGMIRHEPSRKSVPFVKRTHSSSLLRLRGGQVCVCVCVRARVRDHKATVLFFPKKPQEIPKHDHSLSGCCSQLKHYIHTDMIQGRHHAIPCLISRAPTSKASNWMAQTKLCCTSTTNRSENRNPSWTRSIRAFCFLTEPVPHTCTHIQATIGPCNKPKPSPFEWVEKAKWQSWNVSGVERKIQQSFVFLLMIEHGVNFFGAPCLYLIFIETEL